MAWLDLTARLHWVVTGVLLPLLALLALAGAWRPELGAGWQRVCRAGLSCLVMAWVLLLVRLASGWSPGWLVLLNDLFTVAGMLLALAGVHRHLRTPARGPDARVEAEREAALRARLARQDAQEGADKYTRD